MNRIHSSILSGLLVIALFVVFAGCSKESDPPIVEIERTVLVYMAHGDGGGGDLSYYFKINANQMESGMKNLTEYNGRLLCLYDIAGENTTLLEFTKTGRTVLIDYKEHLNTAKPEVFRRVLNDVKTHAPAKGYGVILSSHGSGWLPPPTGVVPRSFGIESAQPAATDPSFLIRPTIPDYGPTKAWGQHGTDWMTTNDMVAALPDNEFDFVMFDACYMASVELLYALRNKAPYFIVSPTEIMGEGFPYHTMIDNFFTPKIILESGLKHACEIYFNYYNSRQSNASIALVYTPPLTALAQKMKGLQIVLDSSVALTAQKFNRQPTYPCYDFTDAYLQSSGDGATNQWQAELSNVVLYEQHTAKFLELPINQCCGLSTYIPVTASPITNEAYRQTDWYKATH